MPKDTSMEADILSVLVAPMNAHQVWKDLRAQGKVYDKNTLRNRMRKMRRDNILFGVDDRKWSSTWTTYTKAERVRE